MRELDRHQLASGAIRSLRELGDKLRNIVGYVADVEDVDSVVLVALRSGLLSDVTACEFNVEEYSERVEADCDD